MIETLDPKADAEHMEKPPTRWKNWFKARPGVIINDSRCQRCGTVGHLPTNGSLFPLPHCKSFPSKDVAESAAAGEARVQPNFYELLEYLGAHPEGEQP